MSEESIKSVAIPQHGQRRFSSNSLGNLYAEAIKAYETAWLHVADAPDGCSANNSSVGGIKLYGRVDRDSYHIKSANLHIHMCEPGVLHLSGTTEVSN